MTWQWLKEHLGWLLLIVVAGGAGKLWHFVSGASKGFLWVRSYVRNQNQEYVRLLELERKQLTSANASLVAAHAEELRQLQEDLETMTRAKDLREDISRQDRDTIRELTRLCDEKGIDYHHIAVHITAIP